MSLTSQKAMALPGKTVPRYALFNVIIFDLVQTVGLKIMPGDSFGYSSTTILQMTGQYMGDL